MAFKGEAVDGKPRKMIIRFFDGAPDLAANATLQKKRTWFRKAQHAKLKSLAISSLPEIRDAKQKTREAVGNEPPQKVYKLTRKVLAENRKNQLARRTS